MNRSLAIVLGIRPDVIRASLILRFLAAEPACELTFIWTGQHYSDNLKDVFFRELLVPRPHIELRAGGETDAEVTANVIARLGPVLDDLQPAATVFLGDTNSVMGCIAAAQLNIPVVHIEGCMRSYDWRMPEEKYRTIADHLADVIYAYTEEYKIQGVAEGINPDVITVVGNPIVDILNYYYFSKKAEFDSIGTEEFFRKRRIEKLKYYVMTCHRRENVQIASSLRAILDLVGEAPYPVYFPASYRSQKEIRRLKWTLPENVIMVDPIGYKEILCLMVNSRGIITDSGTVVEEASILQVPSVQVRKSTERPQVYDVRSSVKFDPERPEDYPAPRIFGKLDALFGTSWQHMLGDGKSSERIVADLRRRTVEGDFARHRPEHYHLPIARSYQEDGL